MKKISANSSAISFGYRKERRYEERESMAGLSGQRRELYRRGLALPPSRTRGTRSRLWRTLSRLYAIGGQQFVARGNHRIDADCVHAARRRAFGGRALADLHPRDVA